MEYAHPNTVQPQGSGLRRLMGFFITARNVKYGAVIVAVLLLSQIVVKDEYKPNILGGKTVGDFVKAETDAARPAIVATQDQIANVQAQAQARAQQQIIAQQYAQDYARATTMPLIIGSMAAQGACAWGTFNNDPSFLKACGFVPTLNNAINQQAGAAMDNLGTTRAWGIAPSQGAAVPAVADAAPLVQAEFDRMYRLQIMLKASVVEGCKSAAPGLTNNDRRTYLACLNVAANEDQGGSTTGPRIIRHY